MSKSRLTILVDEDIKKKVKIYAIEKNKSLSRMVEEYLEDLANRAFREYLENVPIDDEPLKEEDKQVIEESRRNLTEGKIRSLEDVAKDSGLSL